MDRGHLHPHFVKMGDEHFEDSGAFDGEIQYMKSQKAVHSWPEMFGDL